MKKTISISLGGHSFSIEEDAYQTLDAYLSQIRRRFTEDGTIEELMGDIETSIAEKLNKCLSKQKTVVTKEDIDGMIAVMGNVEEIADDEPHAEEDASQKTSEAPSSAQKRLYRNPDDAVIAGVCSGLGAYFGMDPVLFRVLFVILALANGFGILAYLVLWIAIPKAETSAQKLEMRGKPVNVTEIQELMKEKAKMIEMEARAAGERFKNRRQKTEADEMPVVPMQRRTVAARLGRIIRAIFLAIGIFAGVIISVVAFLVMTALTASAAILLFGIGSPYLVSDLPIAELSGNPLYYAGVAAAYILVLIPLIFISLLGSTLVRRKSVFRGTVSGVLIAIWFGAIAVTAIAAVNIVPMAQERMAQRIQEETITKEFTEADFDRIRADGNVELTITEGDAFSISFNGREKDVERLSMDVNDHELQIHQKDRRAVMCFFCATSRVTGTITLPHLNAYDGSGIARASLQGFSDDLVVNLSDTGRLNLALSGQAATATMRDVARMNISGAASTLHLDLEDVARVEGTDLAADQISVSQSDVSRVILQGTAQSLTATLKDTARLTADDLQAGQVIIRTRDTSSAYVWPEAALDAEAWDVSRIRYRNEDIELTEETHDVSRIEYTD